jgi:hypothetical protein
MAMAMAMAMAMSMAMAMVMAMAVLAAVVCGDGGMAAVQPGAEKEHMHTTGANGQSNQMTLPARHWLPFCGVWHARGCWVRQQQQWMLNRPL